MAYHLGERVYQRQLTRRDFLWLMGAGATVTTLNSCGVNPVTGKTQLMLVSEEQEIALDKENSPHQFSSDYGASQDHGLNSYITELGNDLAQRSHRPQMPYSFRAVNATYVNAYAFPGGSIATTRGILVELENEAEFAGLLGHEIGHVNARHSASRMSQGMLAGALLTGVGAALKSSDYGDYAGLVESVGGLGAGALLAHYSRDNEREADALGMEYMTRAGLNPKGMAGLMKVLLEQSKHKPSALEMMFATHPLSQERYDTASQQAVSQYRQAIKMPLNRERYMDNTVKLRQIKPAIEAMQNGEQAMGKESYNDAEQQFNQALVKAPDDYAGLVMMAKCQVALERPLKAQNYADQAKRIYPQEAQAHQVSGVSKLVRKQFSSAYEDFDNYERYLPGNPQTIFLKGITLEGMQDRKAAAQEYQRYLNEVSQGDQAQYAQQRLTACIRAAPCSSKCVK